MVRAKRIAVIDYSGHPFQVQLTRALAAAGNECLHLFTSSSESPKGRLTKGADDPETFSVRSVQLDEPFSKTNFFRRFKHERRIGQMFEGVLEEFKPDIIIAANCPIETLRSIYRFKRHHKARLIFWVQDLLGIAATRVLSAKLGLPGRLVGTYFDHLERGYLREADHIIAISEDFLPILTERYGISPDKISVVENWAPLEDIPVFSKDNEWAKVNLPRDGFRIIYSGTLGFKQNPEVLLDLARVIDGDVQVFSEGEVAKRLDDRATDEDIYNIEVRSWLSIDDLPKALAAADLLVVLLEADAGVFSVPSKVLTYLCTGRPILGMMNSENLAARIIERTGAGIVVPPGDRQGMIAAARRFIKDPEFAANAGARGRAYAENTFNIAAIASKFERVVEQLV